ncbi:MAG: HPF/RaiA family ribosome-associated protein [Candidatus Acidiferrales bacterium]
MKITYSHIEPEFQEAIEHETERHAQKLNRLLKHYAADVVHLHGSLEKTPRKTEFNFSVNLNIPTGTLHATGVGADALGSAKAAFAELEKQVKKHQAKLRKDYVWKRKRAIIAPTPHEAPSSD